MPDLRGFRPALPPPPNRFMVPSTWFSTRPPSECSSPLSAERRREGELQVLFPERWAPQGQSEPLKMERTDIHAIVLSNLHRLSISVLRPPIGRRYPNFDRCTSQGTQRRRPRIWHWNTGPLTPAKHLGGLVGSASIQSGAEHGRRNMSARLSPWNGIKSFRSHHPPLERPPTRTSRLRSSSSVA